MKKIIAFVLTLVLAFNTVTALCAGLYNTYFVGSGPITDNLDYLSYQGEDSSSARQSVHILNFIPGKTTLPIVSLGKSLLSRKTLTSMLRRENENAQAVAGINGDFFSFYTGIPASAVISHGIILSSDAGNNAIGFYPDGNVIIGAPNISLQFEYLSSPAEEILVEETPQPLNFSVYYNKYPTVYAIYLTDGNYSDSTASDFLSREIVLKADADIKIGEQISFEVLEIYEDASDTPIPEDSMVLTIPNVLKNSSDFSVLKKGDKLSLTVTASEGWSGVETAVGGGDIIVADGKFVPETVNEDHEKYKNSRTAVGVREDGSVFFSAIDGDGKSGSGMSFSALAEFMIGEGAITALNLDGGGSTTVAVSFPSDNEIKVLNSLKEGTERSISNSVIFLNSADDTEVPVFASLNTSDFFFLAGSNISLTPTFYTGSRKISDTPYNSAVYLSSNDGVEIKDGIYNSLDITYTDRLFARFDFGTYSVDAEAYINVTDTIDSISFNENAIVAEDGKSFKLAVLAERYGIPVTASLDSFNFSLLNQDINPEEEAPTDDTADEESVQNLVENEYITLLPDGTLNMKNAPMFTELELEVSYKDKKNSLKVYYGKPDKILEDFEGDEFFDSFHSPGTKFLTKGYSSSRGVLCYDGIITYKEPLEFDITPEYFTVYVHKDYAQQLNLVLTNGEKQHIIPYYIYKNYSDISGWIQLRANVPTDLHGSVSVLCPALSEKGKAFAVDNFEVHYGWNVDPFEDISGLWSYEYIMKIYDMGLINGYTEDGKVIFKPENNITRAEFAKMFASYLALDISSYTGYATEFADSDKIAEWASGYIMALSNEGYMNGRSNPDGTLTFDSDLYITRQEAMHVFSKLIENLPSELPEIEFADKDSVQEWALESVQRVVSAGIVTGFDDGTIRADAPVTRGQMCTMFTRLWERGKS